MPTKQQPETQVDELQAEIEQLKAQLAATQGELARRTNPFYVPNHEYTLRYMTDEWRYSTTSDRGPFGFDNVNV